MTWRDRAACIGANTLLFFVEVRSGREDTHNAATRQAKALCDACPVRTECLDFALRNPDAPEKGLWGGMTERERRIEQSRRRRARNRAA